MGSAAVGAPASGGLARRPVAVVAAITAVAGLTHIQAVHVRGVGRSLAVSPDGRTVYAAGGFASEGSVARFARSRNGRLTRIGPSEYVETPAGIAVGPGGSRVYVTGRNGSSLAVFSADLRRLATVRVFTYTESAVVSPDGRFIYVTDLRGVTVLDSALHPIGRPVGLRTGTGLALSGDGRNLYETAGAGESGAIASFARDPLTGALTQLDCIGQFWIRSTCTPGMGLERPGGVAIAGRDVYVASANGVTRFVRDAQGVLAETRIVSGTPTDLATSVVAGRDGVYVAAKDRLSVFTRGLSRRLGTLRRRNVVGLALRGRNLYAGGGGIDVFRLPSL